MIDPRYDTQGLLDPRDGEELDPDEIHDYIADNFEGDELLCVGDEDMVKLHFHTNTPFKVLEYCQTKGEIDDIVVEDMDRQTRGLHG